MFTNKITSAIAIASLLLVDSTVSAVRTFNAAPKNQRLRRRDINFEPRLEGNTLHFAEAFDGVSPPSAVRVSLAPKMPMLIHDDISDHIAGLSCGEDSIVLDFHAEDAMIRARDVWNIDEFVFVTSQPGCAVAGEHTAYVVSFAAATSRSISLHAIPSTLKATTHSMYVDLGSHIVPEIEPRTDSRVVKRREDAMASKAKPTWMPHTQALASSATAPAPSAPPAAAPAAGEAMAAVMAAANATGEVAPTTIVRSAESALTQTIAWTAPTTQATAADVVADISFERIDTVLLPPGGDIAPFLPAAEIINNFELRCANCSLTGTLELDVAGFSVDSNALEAIGEFIDGGFFEFRAKDVFGFFEFDFVIQAGFALDVPSFDAFLPPIPLTPFAIPGVIEFGPVLELTFPITISLDKDVTFTTGFTLDVPDDSRVILNVADPTASNSTGFQDSVLEPLPFSTNVDDLSVTFSAGFRPQLVVNAGVGSDLFLAEISGGVGAFLDVPELSVTVSAVQNQNETCDGPAANGEQNTRLLIESAATLRAGVFFELEVSVGFLALSEGGEQPLAEAVFPLGSQCLLINGDAGEAAAAEPAAPAPADPQLAATEPVATEPVATEPVATESVATESAAPKPAATEPAAPKAAAPAQKINARSDDDYTGAASTYSMSTFVFALLTASVAFATL